MNALLGLALLIGLILLIIFGMRLLARRDDKAETSAPPAPTAAPEDTFGREIANIVQTYDAAPATAPGPQTDEARFQEIAGQQLEPLLRDVVEQAAAGGHKANFERNIENGAARYRLEIKRTDHLSNEPLPYILLHVGETKDVHILVGGTFPGRKAENSHRTEIDWYEVAWKDVDAEIVKFTRKVFHHFND